MRCSDIFGRPTQGTNRQGDRFSSTAVGTLATSGSPTRNYREAVIRAFPRNRIIQLPQSIWFSDSRNLAKARTAFDSHPDLTILVRDRRSLEFARNEFRATSVLCPDMAFALGPLRRPVAPDRDIVCLLRQDIESMGLGSASTELNAVPVDWVADRKSVRLGLDYVLARQHRRLPWLSERCATLLAPLYRGVWEGLRSGTLTSRLRDAQPRESGGHGSAAWAHPEPPPWHPARHPRQQLREAQQLLRNLDAEQRNCTLGEDTG